MILLPNIADKITQRPGSYNSKTRHYIPDINKYQTFWDIFYEQIREENKFSYPTGNFYNKINPYFGYYGYRWHPINFTARYFHIGIDISENIGKKIVSIADGLLEYSGYAAINGNYILISHPDIRTKDGFILYSNYMHCNEIYIKFNLLQKISREFISKKLKFSNIEIPNGSVIASVGDTGNKLGLVPHLHLQLEFINKSGIRIAVNPLNVFGFDTKDNLTSELRSKKEFIKFFKEHQDDLNSWKKFWNNKIDEL